MVIKRRQLREIVDSQTFKYLKYRQYYEKAKTQFQQWFLNTNAALEACRNPGSFMTIQQAALLMNQSYQYQTLFEIVLRYSRFNQDIVNPSISLIQAVQFFTTLTEGTNKLMFAFHPHSEPVINPPSNGFIQTSFGDIWKIPHTLRTPTISPKTTRPRATYKNFYPNLRLLEVNGELSSEIKSKSSVVSPIISPQPVFKRLETNITVDELCERFVQLNISGIQRVHHLHKIDLPMKENVKYDNFSPVGIMELPSSSTCLNSVKQTVPDGSSKRKQKRMAFNSASKAISMYFNTTYDYSSKRNRQVVAKHVKVKTDTVSKTWIIPTMTKCTQLQAMENADEGDA
ncbi:hypothetical protein BC833DRAFT_346745 [Globomyces pollinis-pini]|nr:hypothetical protein BC833DRAFT_346745 [Globomyces pollinis-pini]